MFRNLLLTAGVFVFAGSLTAFAFGVAPIAQSSHAPADGPVVAQPVNLWIPPEDGVIRRHSALVPGAVWDKYAKRPSAYERTGMRVIDPALTVPMTSRVPTYTPPSRKRKGTSAKPAVASPSAKPFVGRPVSPQRQTPPAPARGTTGPVSQQQNAVQPTAPNSPPVVPQKGGRAGPSETMKHPVGQSPAGVSPTPPASTPPDTSHASTPKNAAPIYGDSAPVIGEAQPLPPAAAEMPIAVAPGLAEMAGKRPVLPVSSTPPAEPRKPSPVPSIAPDLAPDL